MYTNNYSEKTECYMCIKSSKQFLLCPQEQWRIIVMSMSVCVSVWTNQDAIWDNDSGRRYHVLDGDPIPQVDWAILGKT